MTKIKPDFWVYYEFQAKGKETHYKWRWLGKMDSFVERFSEDADGKCHTNWICRFPSHYSYRSLDKIRLHKVILEKLNPELKFRLIKVSNQRRYSVQS